MKLAGPPAFFRRSPLWPSNPRGASLKKSKCWGSKDNKPASASAVSFQHVNYSIHWIRLYLLILYGASACSQRRASLPQHCSVRESACLGLSWPPTSAASPGIRRSVEGNWSSWAETRPETVEEDIRGSFQMIRLWTWWTFWSFNYDWWLELGLGLRCTV